MASQRVAIWFGILGVFLVLGVLLAFLVGTMVEDQPGPVVPDHQMGEKRSVPESPEPAKPDRTTRKTGSFRSEPPEEVPAGKVMKRIPRNVAAPSPARNFGPLDDYQLSTASPTFYGVVSNDSGPLPGATVILFQDFVALFGHKMVKRIKTDSKGQFIFPSRMVVRNYKYHLYVFFPGKVSRFYMNLMQGKRFDIHLESGQPLEGRVVDVKGNPIPKAEVLAQGKTWREVVHSGRDGTFMFPLAPVSGMLEVRAQADGYEPNSMNNLTSGGASFEIGLTAGVPVLGKVVDGITKEPIDGATISLGVPGNSERKKLAQTDGDGNYIIKGLPANFAVFFVKAPGYSEFTTPTKIERKESVRYDYELYLLGGIKGQVTDLNGTPIPDAKIYVGLKNVFVYYVPDPNRVDAVSDQGGFFHLTEINANPSFDCKLVADHPDYRRGESAVIKPKPSETLEGITIQLQPGLYFKGRVQNLGGEGIQGATIKVTSFSARSNFNVFFGNTLMVTPTATSDEEGNFHMKRLTAGKIRVEASAENYISKTEMLEIPTAGGLEGKIFVLEPGFGIKGRVTDTAGSGIGNVRIHAASPHPVNCFSNAMTNQEGYFNVKNLKRGLYSITARISGYSQQVKEGVEAGEPKADILMQANGRMSGLVTSAVNGGPVSQFHVNLQKRKFDGTYQWYRDFNINAKDGEYLCSDIDPGTYKVAIRSKDYAPVSRGGVIISTGNETVGINFVLSAGCMVFGKVTDAAGGLVKDVHVVAQPLDIQGKPNYQAQSRTERIRKDGTYKIKGLASGLYQVKPMAGGYCQTAGHQIRMVGDQAYPVDLILNKGGFVRIKVTDKRGQPVPGAQVMVIDSSGNRWGAIEPGGLPGGTVDPGAAGIAAGGEGDMGETHGETGDGAVMGPGQRTGVTGEFKLAQSLCPGPATVKVTALGYREGKTSVMIVDETEVQCRVVLRKR